MHHHMVVGAVVEYCGHNGCFIADLHVMDNVCVVITEPVNLDKLARHLELGPPSYRLVDCPGPNVWKPERGMFVVPRKQVTAIAQTGRSRR